MTSKVTMRVEGLSDLVESLQELPKATSTNVQKRALKEAADPIMEEAQRLAPVRTGYLRQHITVSSKLSPRQKAKSPKAAKVEVYVGPPSMARAIVAEFGSIKQKPHAFMRPAWDANKRTAFLRIRDILAEEIEKTRERLARRAARLLAKKG